MHVAIIDCGAAGATLALQFVKAGFQVTVLERQPLPARETGVAGASRKWTGRRPMTTRGVPIVGKSAHANLFFNCGHGAMGWTMACGAGKIVSDRLLGHAPSIDTSLLSHRVAG